MRNSLFGHQQTLSGYLLEFSLVVEQKVGGWEGGRVGGWEGGRVGGWEGGRVGGGEGERGNEYEGIYTLRMLDTGVSV